MHLVRTVRIPAEAEAAPDGRIRAHPLREEYPATLMAEGLSPAEHAARHAHEWAFFSLDEYSYSDPALDAWIQELGRILRSPDAIDEARRRYLTPDERRQIEERGAEEF